MARTEKEILEDLDTLQELLKTQLQTEGALLFIDLQFIAGRVRDLKNELRISLVENE